MTLEGRFGFLGYGNMGSAILEGLVEAGVLFGKHAIVCEPSFDRREVAARVGAVIANTPAEAAAQSDALLLCVKPQQMADVLTAIQPAIANRAMPIISIAAGISIAYIQQRTGPSARVIRVMPNTPALVGAGATGIALGPNCTEDDARMARTIFEAVGIVEIVPEAQINAVTAVSGSGPAYFFMMVEHLIAAGMAEGLDRAVATRLAAQTLHGAGLLMHTTGEDAAVLRARVTSPGGTTEAALKRFTAEGFDQAVRNAVHAAVARAEELGS